MTCVPILAAIVIQYQAIAAPVLVPVAASTNGGGPTIRTGTVPTRQYQAYAAPVVVPSQVVSPVTGASPVYPAQVFRKRSLHASRQQTWVFDVQWAAPGAVTVPELIQSSTTQRQIKRYRSACYVIAEPEFGVPTEVPVMAWTGHYPDRLGQWSKKRHARFIQTLAWDTVLGPLVVTAPDQAEPGYPERVPRRRRVVAFPQAIAPVFVADVAVVAPALSWQPEYPDRHWPDRALAVRHHLAVAFNPLPIPVTVVSEVTGGRGRYTVPPRARKFIVPPRPRKWTV
jgi:hypothetical protein